MTGQEGSPTLERSAVSVALKATGQNGSPNPSNPNPNTCDRPHTSLGFLTSSLSCFYHHHNSSHAPKNQTTYSRHPTRSSPSIFHHPSPVIHQTSLVDLASPVAIWVCSFSSPPSPQSSVPPSATPTASGALTEHRWSCVQPDSSFRDPPATLPDHRRRHWPRTARPPIWRRPRSVVGPPEPPSNPVARQQGRRRTGRRTNNSTPLACGPASCRRHQGKPCRTRSIAQLKAQTIDNRRQVIGPKLQLRQASLSLINPESRRRRWLLIA